MDSRLLYLVIIKIYQHISLVDDLDVSTCGIDASQYCPFCCSMHGVTSDPTYLNSMVGFAILVSFRDVLISILTVHH